MSKPIPKPIQNPRAIYDPKSHWYAREIDDGRMESLTAVRLSYLDGYIAGMEFARQSHADAMREQFGPVKDGER